MDAAAAAAAAAASEQQQQQGQQQQQSSQPSSPRASAEEACRRLITSGVADAVLQGQVGECCEGQPEHEHGGHSHSHSHSHSHAPPQQQQQQQQQLGRQAAARPLPLPSIVPFSPSAAATPAAAASPSPSSRTAVRAAALGPPAAGDCGGDSSSSPCYWGVVVQSRLGATGTEGCYLLKTVRSCSGGADAGCSCTHYSLTRIAAGEHLEQQFVRSWLV